MVKRPTGSDGEPSSPNCGASAGVKARHLFQPGANISAGVKARHLFQPGANIYAASGRSEILIFFAVCQFDVSLFQS